MRTLILAGSFGEAARYARGKGLRHYRFASSAAAVANFHAQQVVELPGYARRADKHSLNAVARRVVARGGEWIQDEYVAPVEPVDESPLGVLSRMTREDWLMAGATPAEADELTPELTDAQRAEVDRVNDAKTAEPLVNKGSGRGSRKAPTATKRARKPSNPIRPARATPADDPFEA